MGGSGSIKNDVMHKSSSNEQIIQKELVASINTFSFNLFKSVRDDASDVNIFLSPFSVFAALGMLYNGAAGKTAGEIASVLQLADPDPEALAHAFAALWERLDEEDQQDEEGNQLEIANALWLGSDRLHREFLECVRKYYRAEALTASSGAPDPVKVINNWVKEKTKGKIRSIIDSIDPLTILLLLNAVYFKGRWKYPFAKAQTKKGKFFLTNGRSKRLPMMHMEKSQELLHLRTPEFEAVSLPYGSGQKACTYFCPTRKWGSNPSSLNLPMPTGRSGWLHSERKRSGGAASF